VVIYKKWGMLHKVLILRYESDIFKDNNMAIENLNLKDPSQYRENINKAAEALFAGKIIAFPTETVYGLGVNADDNEAIDRLYSVKNRPRNKQMSIMIAESEDVTKYVKEVSPIAKVLIDSFWPGPLTLVFDLPDNKTLGIRNPSNQIVKDVIKTSKVTIASTSANITGSQPAIDAQQVINEIGDKINMVLDDGPTKSRTPSTVVKILDDAYEILRHGIIEKERIDRCLNENSISIGPQGI
jgi:L-threonylcarbamoyladenylate synthase